MNIVERFLGYTKINTTTNQDNGAKGIMPSSPGQMKLAKKLKLELEEMGLECTLRDNAILTTTIPSNVNTKVSTVAFFAHLDTSSERTEDTNAQIIAYTGGDIQLNETTVLSPDQYPELINYEGEDLIVTDGNSLLGADDKAAIAAIINAAEHLTNHPEIKHGDIKIAFVPDEEQGLRGAKAFDVQEFGADFAYTLDCCGIGDFIYENWNAGYAAITFTGQSAHPMSAKGKLKNSLLIAHKFVSMLPEGERPEHTENKEGYYWVKKMAGNTAQTTLRIDVRDFTEKGYEDRCKFLQNLSDSFNTLYGEETVELVMDHSYQNVSNYLQDDNSFPIDIALEAYKRNEIKPNIIAMRGGYDGAVLSQKGLPCPNIFTGAHNFHSIYEYLPINSLIAATNVVIDIAQITYEKTGK